MLFKGQYKADRFASILLINYSKLIFLPFPIIKSSPIPKLLFSIKNFYFIKACLEGHGCLSLTTVATAE